MEKFEEKARCNAKNVKILLEKKKNKQAKKKKQKQKTRKKKKKKKKRKKIYQNQSNNSLYYCRICKNTQTRSHSSVREMRDRVTQYAINLHA